MFATLIDYIFANIITLTKEANTIVLSIFTASYPTDKNVIIAKESGQWQGFPLSSMPDAVMLFVALPLVI